MLKDLHIIAFTHRNLDVNKIGLLHIEKEDQLIHLDRVKQTLQLDELQFLSTCNRVEITFVKKHKMDADYVHEILSAIYPKLVPIQVEEFVHKAETFSGNTAVKHALSVASSIDSMIVGEREIITQVRTAFEHCRDLGLTGDFIRLLMKQVIQCAKQVYTETSISTKPVSVVSLAYHHMKRMNIPLDARILIVGAGVTNTTMCRFLKKHGFRNFHVFNRTLERAEKLAKEIKGSAYALSELQHFNKGFDVIITCTAAKHHVLTPELYEFLLQNETHERVIIDLAIPQDLDASILENHPINYLSIEYLQKISNENLKERSKEILHVEQIIAESMEAFENLFRERKVEIAMKDVPQQVKEIKHMAYETVFREDLDQLDPHAKEILDKIIGYMEKKYISGPMKLAKEIILKNAN
ncbi:MAG: glutamyl-tRNA reductase [Flavobacteriales bacterium]